MRLNGFLVIIFECSSNLIFSFQWMQFVLLLNLFFMKKVLILFTDDFSDDFKGEVFLS